MPNYICLAKCLNIFFVNFDAAYNLIARRKIPYKYLVDTY